MQNAIEIIDKKYKDLSPEIKSLLFSSELDILLSKIAEQFSINGTKNENFYNISVLYLIDVLDKNSVIHDLVKNIGLNKDDAVQCANKLETELNKNIDKKAVSSPNKEKPNLSEELLGLTKKNEFSEQNIEKPEAKPLDAEIMSHFEKPKEEPVDEPAPIPAPELEKEVEKQVEAPIFTYNPHTISRYGSVIPENQPDIKDIEISGEEEKPLPIKPAPAPQPESTAHVKAPETRPVPELDKANEKSADSYHGQDPYREPVV